MHNAWHIPSSFYSLFVFLDSPGWQPHSCFLLLFLAVSLLAVISQYLNFLILPLRLSRHGTCRPSSASMTALWRWPQWLRVLRWRWSCCVWLGWRISSRLMSGPLWRSSAMQASRSVGWGGVEWVNGLTVHSSNKLRRQAHMFFILAVCISMQPSFFPSLKL